MMLMSCSLLCYVIVTTSNATRLRLTLFMIRRGNYINQILRIISVIRYWWDDLFLVHIMTVEFHFLSLNKIIIWPINIACNEPIAECAKNHRSLVSQQNFSALRSYFSNERRCYKHMRLARKLLSFSLWLKVLTKSVRLASYFYCVLSFYKRARLKYSNGVQSHWSGERVRFIVVRNKFLNISQHKSEYCIKLFSR
jgi:hypothetical protein